MRTRQQTIGVAVALVGLAWDQRGKPESANARRRLDNIIATHNIRADEVDMRTIATAKLLNVAFQLPIPRPAGDASWRNPGPPPPPRHKVVIYTGSGPYEHGGFCPACKREFVRRSEHQGNAPIYCSDECHTADRNEKARERMRKARAERKAARA